MTNLPPLNPDRPSVFRRPDGIITFRPSELGKCIRALAATLLGIEGDDFSPDDIRRMKQGHIHEPHIAWDIEEEFGGEVQRQIRLTYPIGEWGSIDGTCDGLWFADPSDINPQLFNVRDTGAKFDPYVIEYTGRYSDLSDESPVCMSVEIKASDDNMFNIMDKSGPTDVYKMQVSCYWLMIEYTLGVKLSGIIFAVGRRRDGQRSYTILEKPFFTAEQIIERCEKIVQAAEFGIDDSDASVDCDSEYKHSCRYWRIHKTDRTFDGHPAIKAKGYEFDPSMFQLTMEHYEVTAEIEELQAREQAIREKIETAMRDRPKVSTPGTRIYIDSRNYVDKDKLALERPDLVAKFQVFDHAAAIEAYPELKKKYSRPSRPVMTIRTNKAEMKKLLHAKGKDLKEPKPKKPKRVNNYQEIANSSDAEPGSSFLDSILDLGKEDFY